MTCIFWHGAGAPDKRHRASGMCRGRCRASKRVKSLRFDGGSLSGPIPHRGARGNPNAYLPMAVRLIFALSLFHLLAFTDARILLALYALDIGAEPFVVGLLAATLSLLGFALSVPAGKFADRFGARWLLFYSALGGAAGMVVPVFWQALPALFLASAVVGLGFTTYVVSLQTLVGLASTPETRAKNFTNYTLVGSVGAFFGPMLAGFSIDFSGHRIACLWAALLTVLPALILAVWGGVLPKGTREAPVNRGGVLTLLALPELRTVLILNAVQNMGKDLYHFYMPIYTHSIGLSASVIGLIMSANAAAFFAVRTVLARMINRYSEERVLAVALFIGAGTMILVPFFHNPIVLAIISFVFGLGLGCGAPVVLIMMFRGAPEGRSGESMGLRMSITNLTKLIGPVAFGGIASVFGVFATFWINAAMLGAGGVLSRAYKAEMAKMDK
jgi:MFS family permease